jgi:hypothetical protein
MKKKYIKQPRTKEHETNRDTTIYFPKEEL